MSALGYDPVPGQPEEVRRVAALFGVVSDSADEVGRTLRQVADGDVAACWRGAAAEAFVRTLGDTCSDLAKLRDSYRRAGEALGGYADRLGEAQEMARRAERDAGSAVHLRATAAQRQDEADADAGHHARVAVTAGAHQRLAELAMFESQVTGDTAGASADHQRVLHWDRVRRQATAEQHAAEHRAQNARTDIATADERLAAARKLAGQSVELRDEAASATVLRLHEASDAGIRERDLFEKAKDALAVVAASPEFDRFLDFLTDAGEVLLALAPVAVVVCAIGGLVVGGPVGFAAGLALGVNLSRGLTAAGLALKGAAVGGRLLQTAVDPSKRHKLAGSVVDLGASAVGAKFFRGAPKGKPLTEGGTGVDLLRNVKRGLSYDDNRRISDVGRRTLWHAVQVAPKSADVRVAPGFILPGETVHHAKTVISGMRFANETGTAVYSGTEAVGNLVTPDEIDDPAHSRDRASQDAVIAALGRL